MQHALQLAMRYTQLQETEKKIEFKPADLA